MFAPTLHASWQLITFRGVLAVLLGIAALARPWPTLTALMYVLGVWLLLEAALTLVVALRCRDCAPKQWWLLGAQAALALLAAIVAFSAPLLAALVLTILIAAWAVLTGALTIAWAMHVRREIPNEWAIAFGGAMAVIFGFLLVLLPATGLLSLVWLLGLFLLVSGVAGIMLGLRLRGWRQRSEEAAIVDTRPPSSAQPA